MARNWQRIFSRMLRHRWLDERDTQVDELRREMRAGFAAIDARMERRFGAIENRLTEMDSKMAQGFAAMDTRMAQGLAGVDAKFTQALAALDSKMAQGFASMDVKFSQRNAELMKWALGFWIASLLGVVGALAALTRVPR